LSFFIDEEHGSRVFPENIESQLSLFLYRNSRRLKDPETGETDEEKLADAIKRVIPKILKAVVRETLSDKNEAAESRLEQAIRTYTLIHQIAIKLILRYRKAYEYETLAGSRQNSRLTTYLPPLLLLPYPLHRHLYRSVVRWGTLLSMCFPGLVAKLTLSLLLVLVLVVVYSSKSLHC